MAAPGVTQESSRLLLGDGLKTAFYGHNGDKPQIEHGYNVNILIWKCVVWNIDPLASAPLADGSGVVVRRVVESDNSCLFTSVGYVMNKSRRLGTELRSVPVPVFLDQSLTRR